MIGFGKTIEFNRFQRAGVGWRGCLAKPGGVYTSN